MSSRGVTGGARRGLAGQIALLTTVVALVAVLLAALVSVGLIRGAAQAEARRTLARQADGYATVLDRPVRQATAQPRLAALLRRQGLFLVQITAAGRAVGPDTSLVPAAIVDDVAAGHPVSTVVRTGGPARYVEGRPLEAGGGIVLGQPADPSGALASSLRLRLLLALAVGLAGAAAAGVLLARRLARPLQAAAQVAAQLSAGRRDVRLRPEGPAEVAAVSEALDDLAQALVRSEARQREFLLSVSHELRTPLTAVVGSAEAIVDGVVEGAAARQAAAVVLSEGQRLDRLVRDLLDLARLGASDFRVDIAPVDLAALVRAAVPAWQRRCDEEGVPLLTELPDDAVVVETDGGRLRQVLDGLAENALRVVPAGAPVVFAVGLDGRHGVLQIRDGGPGLTPDDLAVAFERSVLYERYRGVRRVGTGLGLALVAGLVDRLGGAVAAGTAPEGGAAFTVRLPLAGPMGAPLQP
jgi:two-component system OmpR family sensor kinase